jgi:tetratricopeptide (TPR) repeat protein
METDCVTIDLRPTNSANRINPSPWAWLYELRPPGAREAINCAAGGIEHARLLRAAANPETPFKDTRLFDTLIAGGNIEVACATAVLGMNSVFEAGSDFREFNTWQIRVDQLLALPDLSALGRGALLMQTAIAELLGPGQMDDIQCTVEEFGEAAESADSDAQRIVHASLRGYCELMSGRLKIADAIVRDALHLSPDPDAHPFPKLHLKATVGLVNALRNNPEDTCAHMAATVASPNFDKLPSSLWLICMGHQLLSLAIANQQPAKLEAVADRIRTRSIPSHKHYHRSYTHYALGAATLLTGQPETALFHAETAIEMAKRCHSTVAARTATLLAIQALADLGQHEHALDRLAGCQESWNKAGAYLLIASGALEEAHLNLALARPGNAHYALDRARAALPAGEPLPCNLRRPEFISRLLARLSSPPTPATTCHPDPRPVQITTFGELCVEINGKKLYDRDWHGTRTKTLLKALIVLGGYKVSAERLCDLLWPDADGDVARNNLKVALWRLRHLGCKKGETPLPWVVIQHGHVSLVGGLCRVDCFEFEKAIKEAQGSNDTQRLHEVLASVTDDFLGTDDSANWIILHREYLWSLHRSAQMLAETALSHTVANDPVPIIETAHQFASAER